MSSSVEKIKERLGIEEVVGSYIKLEKAGNNLKARCPFHNEKTPSFYVSPDRGSYYCFGCGAKGDIFSFVEGIEGLDFKGSLKLLAEKAGITLENFQAERTDGKDRIFELLEEATKYFEQILLKSEGPLQYLKKRGITEKTIKDWRIGFVRDEWRTVSEHLKKKGFTDNEIERAGLIKRGEGGDSFYDRFRGRIMFPIFDSAGRVIAYSGRIFEDDGKSAKYLNSPETEVFNKSKILYGFHRAKQAIRKFDYTTLVEGQMDLLMCHQAGFANTVASSGTAFTIDQINLLKRISNKIIMAFDSDTAGVRAAERAWALALSQQMEVKVALMSGDGKTKRDPADVILDSKEKWVEILRKSVHIIDFLLSDILSKGLDNRKIGTAIRKEILPYISLLDSDIDKSYYIKRVFEETGIKEDALWEDLKKIKVEIEAPKSATTYEKSKGKDDVATLSSIERRILGIILWKNLVNGGVIVDIDIMKEFTEIVGKDNINKILDKASGDKNALIFEAESYYSGLDADVFKREIVSLLRELQLEEYKMEQEALLMEIKKAERDKDEDRKLALAIRFNEVSKKLNSLKSK